MKKNNIIKRIEPRSNYGKRIYKKDFIGINKAYNTEKYNFKLIGDKTALKTITRQQNLLNKHLNILKKDNKNAYSRKVINQSYSRFIKSTEKVSKFENGRVSTEVYRLKKGSDEYMQRLKNLDGYKIDKAKKGKQGKVPVHQRGNYHQFNELIQKMGGFASAGGMYKNRVEEMILEYNIDETTFKELYGKQ